MVYIFTATMKEAKPLIKRFSLTKLEIERAFMVYADVDENNFSRNQLYHRPYPKSMVLIVTGIGQFNASAAAGLLLTEWRLLTKDYVINIGIAAGNSNTEINTTYLINKIYSPEENKYYFPRNYFEHDFKEAGLCSGMVPVDDFSKQNKDGPFLFDMEAAGIFNAISHIYSPERIFFLKTVSDSGTDEIKKSPDRIKEVIEKFPDEKINNFIEFLQRKSEAEIEAAEDEDYDDDDADLHTYLNINGETVEFDYYNELNCSASMLNELSKLQKFSWQEDICIEDKLYELIAEKRLPEKSRAESKKIIAEIKNYVLTSL